MDKGYVIKELSGKYKSSKALFIVENTSFDAISPIRMKILSLLAKKEMYPVELAKFLKIHEQKVYYHIKKLQNAGFIEVSQKKEIRGTYAKTFRPTEMNFAFSLGGSWDDLGSSFTKTISKTLTFFLTPFINVGKFDAKIVVGNPDPHGPHKARARDGHYSIDLALFLGNLVGIPEDFSVKLDVDVNLKSENTNLILVGGPVTNLIVSQINKQLKIRFSDKKPWGIYSEKTNKTYTEESDAIIAKIPHPYFPDKYILVLAGISFAGTKASVIAMTRYWKQVLQTYSGQKQWHSVIRGFDLNGDGKIDSIEVLE